MTTNTKGPTMITATEPKCIAKRREELEKSLRELDSLTEHVLAAEAVFGSDRVKVCHINESPRVDLYVDDLREVVPFLHELAMRGYRGTGFYEDDEKTCRCYTRGAIKVWVYLTGSKCRRVQVGTKTMPVYAIQCGEEATA